MKHLKIIGFLLLMFSWGCSSDLFDTHKRLTADVKQFEKVEFEIKLDQEFQNPYDQRDIAVNMKLLIPSGDTLLLPVYFESGTSGNSTWRARFAPREAGEYSYHFEVLKNGKLEKKSSEGEFVAAASDEDGFLHVNDLWTLKFDSGKTFRGIGENIGWEARSFEDPKWTYDYLLPTLANNGANFFRSWMGPYNFPLEWNTVRDTDRYSNTTEYFNPGGIQRLDEVVELADSLGLYMMLAFDSHNAVMEQNQWEIHNYNKANGGPASSPTEFFTLEESREKYKNRLRYLVARWGYSTSIGAWEFFNEIDNAVFTKSDSIIIPHDVVTSWHKEMSAFLQEIDPYDHIITTSLSHREIEGLYDLDEIDLNQMHVYKRTREIPAEILMYTEAHDKPFSWGEFGYEWDWNKDFSTMEEEMIHDYKIGLWYGLFHPTPILPMTWWWEFFDDHNMTPYFRGVAEINKHMLEAGDGSFEMLQLSSGDIESYALKSGQHIYVYLVNHSGSVQTAPVKIEDVGTTVFNFQTFKPETLEYGAVEETLQTNEGIELPEVTLQPLEELVLILSPRNSTMGSSSADGGRQNSQVLSYLYEISGEKIIAGQHNKEPNADPDKWTEYIKETTGEYPALWSGDFLFQQDNIDNRWKMIHEAKEQWDNGAMINLMWHACPPDQGEPCEWDPGLLNAQLSDAQWEELLTPGSELNKKWIARMDDIAVYLQFLKDEGVEVLFRPFHEMNQGLFWWAGRPGPEGTAALYRLTHDYLTQVKGLNNLVWVWDMQDLSRDFEDYNPGEEYWDVFAFDIYDDGYDISWYNYILPIVGDKPMAIGECSKLPGTSVLEHQKRWVFFMPWAELVKESNTEDEIREVYNHIRVITRDEMPGWK